MKPREKSLQATVPKFVLSNEILMAIMIGSNTDLNSLQLSFGWLLLQERWWDGPGNQGFFFSGDENFMGQIPSSKC